MNKDIVSSSKYDIYSKLMFIANKYFDIQNEDFLKVGLFGYITESMATIARDSSFHKTMLYNESFLNTAVMPKSVYNYAKMFGVSVPAATPAYADIQMTMPIDSLNFVLMSANELSNVKYNKYGNDLKTLVNKQVMIIDRSNQFIAGQYKFALERSLFLYKNEDGSGPITVKYCTTEEATTLLHNISNYFIKTFISQDSFISFVVRAFQYEIREIDKQITSSSFLDTKIHRFFFTDQFVGARLSYIRNSSITPIELRFSNIETNQTSNRNFAYYNLVDENAIQITFSSGSNDFMPSANSTLRLELYTTKGAAGNITYTGDVVFRFQEESLKNIPVLAVFFDNISLGGINIPDISRLKSTIINEISTRDVIVTEADLNSYFLILTSLLENVNDGKIVFIKKRDDILRRVFSAYILMRDGLDLDGNPGEPGYASKIIPTNTITADFAISSNMSKPFGTVIKLKEGTLNQYEYVPTTALSGSDDYYVVPFYMRVNLDPFRKVKYIYNLTDDSTSLSYKTVSASSGNITIIPSTISVKRGLEGSNASPYYIIAASFVTDRDFNTIINESTQFNLRFIPRGSTTPSDGKFLSFVKDDSLSIISISSDDDANRFSTTLEFAVNVNVNGSEFDFSDERATNDYGTFLNVFHNDTTLTLPENVKIDLEIIDNSNPDLNSVFISDKDLLFFRNLDELMFSDINMKKATPSWYLLQNRLFVGTSGATNPSPETLGALFLNTTTPITLEIVTAGTPNTWEILSGISANDYFFSTTDDKLYYYDGTVWAEKTNVTTDTSIPASGTNEHFFVLDTSGSYSLYQYDSSTYITSVTIKDIPVVHQSFFNSEANQTKFIKQLFIYIDTLKENLGKLETNTFFDLKFYNTYGPSQYYNSLRTDMNLELDVYVYEYSDTLASAIRDLVRLLVDGANNRKALRISSLIKDLTSSFDRYIDHIDFKGLNGTFTQYIKEDATITKNLFAPEYFNIPIENIISINVQEIAAED
jgi:hypothetical protein